jgi:septal ring factor EnvC (AmiA/AmiB activator)
MNKVKFKVGAGQSFQQAWSAMQLDSEARRADKAEAATAEAQAHAETYAGECGRLRRQVDEARAEAADAEREKLAAYEAMAATRVLLESALAEWEGDDYITQGPQQEVKRNLSDAIARLV